MLLTKVKEIKLERVKGGWNHNKTIAEWRGKNCNKAPRLVKREVPRMAVLLVRVLRTLDDTMLRCSSPVVFYRSGDAGSIFEPEKAAQSS
jgi:hypothetical protein